MFSYTKYLNNYKRYAIIGPIFKWMEAAFELLVPLIMASIIDVGIKGGDINYVYRYGLLIAAMGAVGLIFALICQKSAAIASQGFGTNLRNELFAHINTLSYSELDKLGEAALKTRLTSDIYALEIAVSRVIRLLVRSPFLVVGAVVMTMLIDIETGLLMLLFSVVVAFVLYIIMQKTLPQLRKNQKSLEQLSSVTYENLDGARVIKAFSKRSAERKRFSKTTDKLYGDSVILSKINSLLNPASLVIINLGIIAILWRSGYKVNAGALTQGQVIAFVNYMLQIFNSMIVIAMVAPLFTKAKVSSARVQEILNTKNSLTEKINAAGENLDSALSLELKNAGFAYKNSGGNALSDISLKVKAGGSLGVIGGTGSGKTTLINLIARFYDLTEGEILIGNIDINDYPISYLRKNIAVVPQVSALFSGTIEENLKWGKENADAEQIDEALKIACAYDFVYEKTLNVNTKVLEGGKNFSGGQRQRLAIARAVIKKPKLLILDDSFSALDFVTDKKLRQNLKKLKCTTVYISQRAASIKNCDQILVLNNGRAECVGRHAALIKNCSLYRQICEVQGMAGAYEK